MQDFSYQQKGGLQRKAGEAAFEQVSAGCRGRKRQSPYSATNWMVVKIMVPFGVPIIIRHLIFRIHQKRTII